MELAYPPSEMRDEAGDAAGISSVEDLNQAGKVLAVKSGSTGHMYAKNNLPEAELLVPPDERTG